MCSPTARLLFIGLWSFCDDGGVHPASIKRLKMEVLPADAIDDDAMGKLIGELVRADLVREFHANGERFWHVTGWDRHQRIDKPTIRHPRPPDRPANSTTDHRAFDEGSTNARRDIVESSPPDRNGVEGKGVEATGREETAAADAADDVPPVHASKVSKKRTRSTADAHEPSVFPKELDTPAARQALEEWREHRRQKRNRLTPIQESKLLAEWAAKGSERFVAAVNRSIAGGWSGVFEAEANGQRPEVGSSHNDPRGNRAAGLNYLEMFGVTEQ